MDFYNSQVADELSRVVSLLPIVSKPSSYKAFTLQILLKPQAPFQHQDILFKDCQSLKRELEIYNEKRKIMKACKHKFLE